MDLTIVPVDAGRLAGVERSTQQYLNGFGEKIHARLTMWLILGGPEPIVVDAGAGPPEVVRRQQGRELVQERDPREVLHTHGVDPAEVRTIVLTHLHWDHCLGLAAGMFPNAMAYLQRRELQYAAAPYPVHARLYDRAVLHGLEGEDGYPALRLVDGDLKIAPGVRMVLTPGHTPGTAAVLVDTAAGTYAIASDNVPLQSSWTGPTPDAWIPNGIHVDLEDCYSSLARLATEATVVLPSHDDAAHRQPCYPPPGA